MTPEERAAEINLCAEKGSVTLLGGWELDEDGARQQIVTAIRAAVAEERERCAGIAEAYSRPVLMDGMEILRLKTTVANALDIAKAIRGGAV